MSCWDSSSAYFSSALSVVHFTFTFDVVIWLCGGESQRESHQQALFILICMWAWSGRSLVLQHIQSILCLYKGNVLRFKCMHSFVHLDFFCAYRFFYIYRYGRFHYEIHARLRTWGPWVWYSVPEVKFWEWFLDNLRFTSFKVSSFGGSLKLWQQKVVDSHTITAKRDI